MKSGFKLTRLAPLTLCWQRCMSSRAKVSSLLLCLLVLLPAAAAEKQVLRGHVPLVSTTAPPVDRLPGGTRLRLAIGLPWRNREALTNLLRQIYDPTGTNYHQYLTPQQFTEWFGPTEEDYNAAIAFARAKGLTVTGTHPNRMLLDVSGTVTDIEQALHVVMRVYAHPTESRNYYAPDVEPAPELSVPLLHISGLDNRVRPHPKSLRITPITGAASAVPHGGSGPSGTYRGSDFRTAYVRGTSLNGSGQLVGMVEFGGYFPSDIASYENQSGLSAVPLQNVPIDGFDGSATVGDGSNSEVSLDIDMAISMAPHLSGVIVYEASPSATMAETDDLLNRMATDNLAAQLSCSWGFDLDVNSQQILEQYAAQGQSFFLASGDIGAFVGAIEQPSDDPHMTVVGGTVLTTSSSHLWSSETTWPDSSGGISTIYPIPVWQQGISMALNQGSTTMRNLPDVAMIAQDIWLVSDNGQSGSVAGTSASSPLWAGFTALVNQQAAASGMPRVGFLNPTLYAIGTGPGYQNNFHDITTGNNTSTDSPSRFYAVAGYDLCTGWGSPTGTNLINALLVPPSGPLLISPPFGFTANGSAGGPFNVTSQQYSLTNAGTASLNWSLVNTSAWLIVSPTSGTLTPGGPAVTVTATLNPAAANLLIGAFTANVGFTNLNDGAGQSRQFSLVIGNGGFETGDFTDWNLSAPGAVFVDSIDATLLYGSPTIPGIDDSQFVHSGFFGAFLGQSGSLGSLSKNVPTVPGQRYLLSFWLANPASGTPNEFLASWNGLTLVDRVNMGSLSWTNLHYLVTATAANSVLQFQFRNDPNALGLDDVTVQPIPAPTIQSVTATNGTIRFRWNALSNVSYQVQYATNLNSVAWKNLGGTIAGTNDTAATSDALATTQQRFYRILVP
ncbi:MAG TPA: protease pro-enzyme activation domain-containing protein [Candidatus Nitrosotalea sp.]|nr:protease pro-enzyme activation domain-containing protein [Candidatus Nitrosotalea sp.]